MSPEERRLLRDVNRWRRGELQRAGLWPWPAADDYYESADGETRVSLPYWDDTLGFWRDDRAVTVWRGEGGGLWARYPVKSVTEAVDVLCALGVLPARFSTAYKAGWADGEAAGWKNALKLAGDLDRARRVARTAAAVLTPDAPEVT